MKAAVVDTDALIALINKDDQLAGIALSTLKRLHEHGVRLLYPTTVIIETTTTLQRKLSDPSLTLKITRMVRESQFEIVVVDKNILELAESLFRPTVSKHNTLFDAVVAAVARNVDADAIFGFNKWYEKVGLKLASNVIAGVE